MSKSIKTIDEFGDVRWYKEGSNIHHREDGPAIEFANGDKLWCLNGRLHRVGGPAVENINGTKEWAVNGKTHREDGPAIEYSHGHKEWWLNDRYCSGVTSQEDFITYRKLQLLK